MEVKTAIIVLGMHRSGTSLLCKAISALGVDFGNNLLAGDRWNSKGYFENYHIQQLNDRLLRLLGVRWDTLDISHWEDALPWTYSLRSQAIEILRKDFANIQLWGIKDPRMCRLLPFWKEVFNELDTTPLYVLALRNPLNVALSLEKRDGLSIHSGSLLWLSHMASAVIDSKAAALVEYEDLLTHPFEQMDRLCNLLNLPNFEGCVEAREYFVSSFIDRTLQHNQESTADLNEHPDVPGEIKDLYADMRWMARNRSTPADWERLRDSCADLMTNWWPCHVVSTTLTQQGHSLSRENIALIGRLRSELLNQGAENATAQTMIDGQAALLGAKDVEIMRLRGELEQANKQLGELNLEKNRLGERLVHMKMLTRRYELLMKISGINSETA